MEDWAVPEGSAISLSLSHTHTHTRTHTHTDRCIKTPFYEALPIDECLEHQGLL